MKIALFKVAKCITLYLISGRVRVVDVQDFLPRVKETDICG